MAAKTPILDVLAKELGYKSGKELKTKLQSGGGLSSRLESGQGIGEAVKGSISDLKVDVKRAVDPKRFAKEFYMNFFGGKDVFSAYMRGRLNKKVQDKAGEELSPTPEAGGKGGLDEDALAYLRIIAKSSLSLHLMSRDVNVLRQNIQKLTKIEAETYNEGKKKKEQVEVAKGADAYFLKEEEKEAKLEASRERLREKPVAVDKEGKEKEDGGGLLSTIIGFFSNGLLGGLKALLNPSALLKVLGKVFVFATIFISLFKGITAAFDKWKESGDLKESIIAGLGAIVDFLTFGLFGEDSVRKLFDAVGNFLDPIIDTISGVVTSMKDWIVNNFGIPKISLGSIKNPFTGTVYELGSIGPYYPFKKNPKSEAPEKTEKKVEGATKEQAEKARSDYAQNDPRRLDKQTAAKAEEAAPATKTPTPESKGEASMVEKAGGVKLKLPSGVTYNAKSGDFIYNGVPFKAETQDEMDQFVKAINNKTIVEMQSKDSSGAPVTKVLDGTTGEVSVKPPKVAAPEPLTAQASVDVTGAPGAAGPTGAAGPAGPAGEPGAAGASGGATSTETSPSPMASSSGTPSVPSGGTEAQAPSGGASQSAAPASETQPTEEKPPAPMTASVSGQDLNNASMAVAEEQRMESSADEGNTIINSSTNKKSVSPDKPNTQIADVYDSEFASLLARA